MCARLSGVLGLVVIASWIVGRVLTDQYHWSQLIWWIPPLWMIGLAWILLAVSALCAKIAKRPGGLLARPILLVVNIACSGYLILGVWHMHRVVMPHSRPDNALRVVYWNQSADHIDQVAWGKRINDQGADLVIVSNAQWGTPRQTLLDQFAAFAPSENERWINYSYRVHGQPSHYRVEGSAIIASRFPMLRTGMVNFGSSERQQVLDQTSSDQGWVMFVEIDLRSIDPESESITEPMVVWIVDLPSDPLPWKQAQMRQVNNEIEQWDGSGWRMGKHVWEQERNEGASFPDPDLIIGDFNTPRGSDSLKILAPGYRDAFESSGYGRARSWKPALRRWYLKAPIALGDWHIDLALTNDEWDARNYLLIDPKVGPHAMQMVDLVRK